ncbi:transporter, cation-chloride cotransporter (CCC) family [Fodinibius salinus]|uniref:Transporter, cation-chloride cotransporter (CCC) family n=1 Tax=Fodinibius salinus TaxID=860790 RepID=A0A5D3YIF1_9BACT|nr:amino acid permease [Fodinibius salinus]TYP93352.1 transporter, cation-chloride cotransporter (CCC) family [Fodinibius salinus]
MSNQQEEGSTLQQKVDERESTEQQKYGTFGGVFVPTLLTILGVILFLRQGWVIGNAGLLGGWMIITLAFVIVSFTALSMSCITTNIRIEAGGAYSIISQSLGLEVGGSVGVPLYLAQTFAITMYIFGFREGWLYIFPDHYAIVVDIAVFAVLFLVAFLSAKLAFRIQYIILAVIVGALISVGATVFTGAMEHSIQWWGSYPGAAENDFQGVSFWVVFAVLFPAATGIMAGANMSGELKNPKKSIPLGTLSAIAISYVIYMASGYWMARVAPVDELVSNYNVMIDYALWAPAVLGGLLGATFSSALASIVGAPRILQALGEHKIFPGGDMFAKLAENGEPRNAILLTGGLVLATLLLRDLNTIAPLITMFFLITYMMINMVVFIEQRMDMISFRPTFRIPKFVPLLGTVGCLFTMFIINSTFGLVALGFVLVTYLYLSNRRLKVPYGDMRSGLFVSLAEWAAKRVSSLPEENERAWKANLLVPVRSSRELRGNFSLIRNLTYPKGSVKLVGISDDKNNSDFRDSLMDFEMSFSRENIYSRWSVIDSGNFKEGVLNSLQTLQGTFFRPNILFLRLPAHKQYDEEILSLINQARLNNMGIQLYVEDTIAQLGRSETINVWIHEQGPDWDLSMELGNMDLALLTAYKLKVNWGAQMRVITIVDEPQVEEAYRYLENLLDVARIPDATPHVEIGTFQGIMEDAPQADLNLMGLPEKPDLDDLRSYVEKTQSACVFVADSGKENILA